MPQELQPALFTLTPRDEGKAQVDLSVGGLSELVIRNFKGISELLADFGPITLICGANNSGKSTLLQAIRLFYYCIEKCGVRDSGVNP